MIVPIVSKKSLSMIEKITRLAVTAPSLAKSPKSRRPKVDKSGAWTMAAGIRPAPGVANPWPAAKTSLSTIAITVVARMPISSAPRVRRAMSHAERMKPMRKTVIGKPRSVPSATGNGPAAGLTTRPEVKKPMNAMKRPMPTLIARLSPIGTASMSASRKRVSTSMVMTAPSRNTTVIAWGHESPRPATRSKATTALSPMPAASAKG